MGIRRVLSVSVTSLALCGCHPLPEMRSYELPQNPTAAERKALTVPHRDWLSEGCWFRSEKGHDVKVCK